MPLISIVVPVLDEAPDIGAALAALQPLRAAGAEVIVVDGGSGEDTVARATPLADRVIAAPRGRASQMNAGAAIAGGEVLLFLHADTTLPEDALTLIAAALRPGAAWGRFDVAICGTSIWLPLVAALMNRRSRLTGIATGDQAMFVTRSAFAAVGGFPDLPLMEDIELSKRLLAHSRPACIATKVTTSGRRWERHGVWRTILTMWWLRLRYFLGADLNQLAREYGHPDFDHCCAFGAVTVRQQPEGDLGARMLAALRAAPTAATLVIGTDCPALTATHLHAAARALDGNDVVLLPAEDGGYVLVGATRPLPGIFAGVDWGSDQVMAQTRVRLRTAELRWSEPATLWDVDRPEDLARLAALYPEALAPKEVIPL
ncbi:MAG: TIGR04283 family arsenosugar biosynthesis glycosyltransferase [Rhodocyclales bacterium]|nr:TIGR04283 family arsenosugar biosynthesis glycosyltransferase [Rhodocyclales bacterium]